MIGVVVVAHGGLAEEFVRATEHVVGLQAAMRPVGIGPDDDPQQCQREILAAVDDVDSGVGVIVLTDMFGGTPSNLAIGALGRRQAEVIAGINLPMLVKLASIRGDGTMAEAVAAARDAGRKYICIAPAPLPGEQR